VIKFTDGRWFSPGTLASSTTKTGRYDIAEILLKVALNTKNSITFQALFYTHDKMDVWFFSWFSAQTPPPPKKNMISHQ
jgi:hypothetical protein